MKKLLLIIPIFSFIIFISQCKKQKEISFEDTILSTNYSSSSYSSEEKIEEKNEYFLGMKLYTATYINRSLGLVSGTFCEFFNENHNKGYVIIKEIEISNIKYSIVFDNPAEYISLVHSKTLKIKQENNKIFYLNDCPERVQSAFRTIEAVAIVYFEDKDVTETKVYEAGKRMFGRKTGVKRN
jgi:hypothetical protein